MKEHIGQMVGGNFYTYNLYKYTDGKGLVLFIAEPKGFLGATRSASTVQDLEKIINIDVKILNYISKERHKK